MGIIGVVFGLLGLIFLGVAVRLFGRFKNINRRLKGRYGTKPSLRQKWRGNYPSNAAWRGLVIEISFALLFGITGTAMAIVFIYTLETAA